VSIQFTIDHTRHFVHAHGTGTIVLRDILEYFDAVVTQDGMPYPKLIDARHVDFDISDDDMMVLGAHVSAYAQMEPRGPIAMVVSTGAADDFGRRFANLGGAKRPFRIFRSIEDAQTWLDSAAKS
jgi:hypothetical protein